jgi:hypothetical protein
MNCSRKRKAECKGPNCQWEVGRGCRRSQAMHIQSPVQLQARPVPCYKKRKAECKGPNCQWEVGRGCRPLEQKRSVQRSRSLPKSKSKSPSLDRNPKMSPGAVLEKFVINLVNYHSCYNEADFITLDDFDEKSDIIYILHGNRIFCYDAEGLLRYLDSQDEFQMAYTVQYNEPIGFYEIPPHIFISPEIYYSLKFNIRKILKNGVNDISKRLFFIDENFYRKARVGMGLVKNIHTKSKLLLKLPHKKIREILVSVVEFINKNRKQGEKIVIP